ncbi:UNVERIFIED_CONTAM: hypothetical protein GTU68_054152 [Idotea baltica]|nr:hypothetical protein [Idotea baltica]
MSSIFSKIIAGEIPAYKIHEDENYLAFLDIFPVAKGHCLVIPKVEIDYFFDLDDKTRDGLLSFATKIAKAMDKAFDCERIGLTILGLEVPHAHIHLVPLDKKGIIDFTKDKLAFNKEEFETIAKVIRAQL